MSEAERLAEVRLGKWASHAYRGLLYTAEQQAEFNKIHKETPAYFQKYGRTYLQKNSIETFNEWQKFILQKGYRPRTSISQRQAKQSEEIRLVKWANAVRYRRPLYMTEQQWLEFNKIWQEAPTYIQKNK